ncbi:MAG: AlpA family phage regulatory protein [Pseudomonadota bacterium]
MSDRFLSPKATSEMVSLPVRSIRRLVTEGRFPSAVHLSEKRIAYLQSEVENWMADKLKASGKEPSKRILSFEKETPDQGLTAPDPAQLESRIEHDDTYTEKR